VLVVSFCSLLLLFGPADALPQTRRLEPPPPSVTADFNDLVRWLVTNSGHSAFAGELDRTLDSAQSVADAYRIADEVLPVIANAELLASAARAIGRVALTVRDFERALELYDTAYIASGGTDLESLFAQAQSLLQLGELASAEQRARTIVTQAENYELKRRAYALIARSLHLRGRDEDAARLLATLSELDDPSLVEPETLLLQSSVLASIGEDANGPIAQLERLHPRSIAMRLVRGDLVEQAPLPAALLTGPAPWHGAATGSDTPVDRGADGPGAGRRAAESGATAAAPSQGAGSTGPAVTAIQVGSFSDPDNARHLVGDLEELGLDAFVETADRDGRSLSLVLVDIPAGTPAGASRVLGVLRDAGYDGFLIY
jgi:tetratricopeptide (TPR) repeat protein